MEDLDDDSTRLLRRGRLHAAHVAGLGFGLVLAGFAGYTDWPPLELLSGVAFGISGVAGLMSEGVFWLSPRFRFLRYWACLPILGFGMVGIVESVGHWTGWLR